MPLPLAGRLDFTWFIYGSSLDRDAFEAWAREHGYDVPDLSRGFPARLDGRRLAFDVASRYWGGAVGNLVTAPDRTVEGLALPMPAHARALADHKEGANSGLYQAIEVTVTPLAGGNPTAALAYVASPDRRLSTEAPPSPAWLDAVIRGARAARLSDAWIRDLENLRP